MTSQQREFARHLANGCSGAEAARRAGYSERSARRTASRLRSDARVSALVTRLQQGDPSPAHETGAVLTPEQFLRSVMSDATQDARLRFACADALLALDRKAKPKQGKKEIAAERAEQAFSGRFAPLSPPRDASSVVPFRRRDDDLA